MASEIPTDGDSGRSSHWSLIPPALLALIIGGMAAIMFAAHRPGHWWGDDWALYIRQAQGLLDLEPGRVIDENRFTVEASRGAAFSPPLYPWGFPMLLAPFVAVFGNDVDQLALVQILCAVVFASAWYALAKPRIGIAGALVGTVAATLTPLLLGWTELIQSEWPFLAVTAAVLVALDRAVTSGSLTSVTGPWWPLVLLGIGATAAFSVRREGLGMTAAIAAAQAALLIDTRDDAWWRPGRQRERLALRLLTPHLSALATVGLLQWLLPSTLVPRYSGTSIANVWKFRRDHLDHLAEVAGLKRSWQDNPVILGSDTLGWVAVIAYITVAAIGIILAFTIHRRRDLHLVAYLAAALAIGGSFRSPLNRYIVTIAPLALLLGLVTVYSAFRRVPGRHTARVVVALVALPLVVGNVWQAVTRIDDAQTFTEAGGVEWGAQHPEAVEMFAAVTALTDTDDIVAAPKARAMTLETGRLSVQVDQYRPVPESLDIALFVVERGNEFSGEFAALPGYDEVWSNRRFVLYQPNRAANASTNGAGSSSTASP